MSGFQLKTNKKLVSQLRLADVEFHTFETTKWIALYSNDCWFVVIHFSQFETLLFITELY